MKDEYDFAAARRGRFHHPDAILSPPVHLAPDVGVPLGPRAGAGDDPVDELVNALLKNDIERMEKAG